MEDEGKKESELMLFFLVMIDLLLHLTVVASISSVLEIR